MSRFALLAFGVFAYACFLASFAAGGDFLSGAGFVRGIDAPAALSVPATIAMDVVLLALFGISHSVMARPGFKRRWTKVVPQAAERSVYVLTSSIFLGLAFWQWRALPASIAPIWNVTSAGARAALWALAAAGFGLAIASTFMTNHFDLFGLRQVSPTMTWDHALFAIGMTAYIAIGITFEERDLERTFGERYRRYRREVRAVIPLPRFIAAAKPPTSAQSPGPG